MKRSGTLTSGLALGLLAGAADGIAIVFENPRSFENVSIAGFLGAALSLGGAVGLVGGAIAAALRLPPGAVLVPGIALAVFGMAGVRVHVRWFFGEPLLAPGSLLANVALAAGSAGVAWMLWKAAGRELSRRLTGAAPAVASMVLFVAGALVALATRPAPSQPARGPVPELAARARDVLLVTLDTTRADHLSCYGYPRGTTPAIDRLARAGFQWEGAYAPIPLTAPSHASMLTGLLPRKHGVLNNGQPLRVSTFVQGELGSRGWHCAAFVSGIPLKRSSGLAQGFHTYDDAFSPLEAVHPMLTSLAVVRIANRVLPFDLVERRAEDTCAAAIAWLHSTDSPRFLWVHLFDPHTPYDAPDVLRRRFGVESPAWTAMDRPVVEWPIADYDAELRETDRWLEDLLRAFHDATGGEGEVILTADHGEGLEQHGELAHGTQLHEEDVLVPFVTSHSILPILQRDGPEIVPTVFEVREVANLVPLFARTSMFGRDPMQVPETILCETFAPEGRQDRSAVIEGMEFARPRRKILHDWETGETVGLDLDCDPGERHPLEPLPAEWSPLMRFLPDGRVARAPRPELDPDTVRRLRALGYVH